MPHAAHDRDILYPSRLPTFERVAAPAAGTSHRVGSLDSSLTISQVAAHLGYADHAHLTREFRHLLDLAPVDYRHESRFDVAGRDGRSQASR
ncbi:AraC family transcriptional regulator [Tessaracoccus caeni]|uniref:AraC family transcriptional regulator n=1 Tax=Tessaracoccus caeni TaxID=3031239 RepID=UPI0038734462